MSPRLIIIPALIAASACLALHALDGPAATPGNPLASARRLDPAPLDGRVREALRAGSYTYMALDVPGADEPVWVVVMGPGAASGQPVQLTRWAHYQEFKSPRLGRSFAPLYLATAR